MAVTPMFFNISILKPLAKNVNADVSNLRTVAVSDCVSNLFESVLLTKLNEQVRDNKKRMGFKQNSSCSHAVFMINQSIKCSVNLGRRVYICAIDVSKAFDKVNRTHLWAKLIDLAISPALILAIMSYYNDSFMMVLKNGECGKLFQTTVGVRQGGVLSPKLFSIYIDGLIKSVEALRGGVEIVKVN